MNTKFTAITTAQKRIIKNWIQNQSTWPSDEEFHSLLSSHFPSPCSTFYKRGVTDEQILKRIKSITVSLSKKNLENSSVKEIVQNFWSVNKMRLLPLPKVSTDEMFFQQSQTLLKLPEKEVNKFWHLKHCQYIGLKSEGYRLGLTNCQVCKMNLVKIVGGKCTRPEHSNITKAKEKKRKQDAEHKKRAKERTVETKCKNVTARLFSTRKATRIITDKQLSKTCVVNGYQFLDPTRLRLDKDSICDACNGLAGTFNIFACDCYSYIRIGVCV